MTVIGHKPVPVARHGDLGRTLWRCETCGRKVERRGGWATPMSDATGRVHPAYFRHAPARKPRRR